MAARGRPAPALVVVKAPDIRSAAARQGIAALAGWHSPAIGQPVEVTVYPAANLAEIQIPLAGTGTDAVPQHALTTLHNTIVPATVGKIPGGQALVGGNLAENNDFNNQLQHGIVPVILFVLGITFILMTIGFDSIVIATTTIGLNLLKGSDLTFDHPYNGGYLCTSRRASAPSVTSRHHRRQLGPRVCVGLGLAGITPVRRGCCARGGAAV